MESITKRGLADAAIYHVDQYLNIVKATIASCTISMISSLLIILFYIHLRIYSPSKANRVSLRCVFYASWMNLIDSIFDICSILLNGDTAFCRSTAVITMFARVMSATLLALVGVNLVLVFVVNISSRTASQLEWGYYCGALLYGIIAISVPISEETKSPLKEDSPYRCYYYAYYYQVMNHSSLLWMWYYGFLSLIILVAICCSIIASIKLMREHHNLLDRFSNIASSSQAGDASSSQIQERMQQQNSIFLRVVSRCVIYPLVPFISNIWGFIVQLMLVNPKASTPGYPLAVLDTVFGSLQGFFVAIVFFSDPAMSEFVRQGIRTWKQKYLDEFSRVRKYDDGKLEIISSSSNNITTSKIDNEDDDKYLNTPSAAHTRPSTATPPPDIIHMNSFNSINNDSYTKRQAIYDNSATTLVLNSTTIPMRCIDVSSSMYSRISLSQQSKRSSTDSSNYGEGDDEEIISCPPSIYNNKNGSTVPSISVTAKDERRPHFTGPDSNSRILIPYKYPSIACFIHWCLKRCCGRRQSRQEQEQKRDSPSVSNLPQQENEHIAIPICTEPTSFRE